MSLHQRELLNSFVLELPVRRTAAAGAPGAYESIFSDLKTVAGDIFSNLKKIFLDKGQKAWKVKWDVLSLSHGGV